MIRKIGIYILLFLVMVSCGRRPLSVLSHDKMVDILLDIHLTEATLNTIDPYADRIEKQEYYNSIFLKYGITKSDFDKSVDWYTRHPKKMILIYDDVKKRTDVICSDINDYKYHPELIPTHNDSIDTFDLWRWRRKQLLQLGDSLNFPNDTLFFKINNKDMFNRSEQFRFYLKMRVSAEDSVFFKTSLIFHYSDSVRDTLQTTTLADSLCRRYIINKYLNDSVDLDSIDIRLVDQINMVSRIEIDSVEFNRVYNNFEYPMDYYVKKEIRDANDSINKILYDENNSVDKFKILNDNLK